MQTAQLTARQFQILGFVAESMDIRGYAPTLREIGARFAIGSTNGVNEHLTALERKGMLLRGAHGTARTMRITPAARDLLGYAPKPDGKAPVVPSTAPVVAVRYGWRCGRCNFLTFDLDKPCTGCRLARQRKVA